MLIDYYYLRSNITGILSSIYWYHLTYMHGCVNLSTIPRTCTGVLTSRPSHVHALAC